MPDGTKRIPVDSGDLEDIANWLADAPTCLREAWEERGPVTIAPPSMGEIMARDWVVIDEMRQRYEEQAAFRRAAEKAERRELAMLQADWRASRGTR